MTTTQMEKIGQLYDTLIKPQLAPVAPPPPPLPNSRELDASVTPALVAFEQAKALIKFADEQKDQMEALIRQALDGAKIGTIDGVEVVRLTDSHNSSIDQETLKDGWPEAYEATHRRTDYDYVRVAKHVK